MTRAITLSAMLPLLFGLAACKPAAESAPPAPSAQPAGRQELAPFPYTVEQIRIAIPAGTVLVYRMQDGDEVTIRETTFFEADAEGAKLRDVVKNEAGELLEQKEGQGTWTEFHGHAAFPAAATTIEDETVTTPAGSFPCKLYTVKGDGKLTRYWFAVEQPGPPVRYEVEQDGSTIVRGILIERRRE